MFAGCVGGLWTFVAGASRVQINVGQDSSPSKVKIAFDAAYAALSSPAKNTLFGFDPRGNKFAYTGVGLAKKFER